MTITTIAWLKKPTQKVLAPSRVMECPRCGESNLHQAAVKVFNRTREDAPTRCTIVDPDGLVTQTMTEDNPSPRRDGLEMAFLCEHCGDGLRLAITQHKGATYVQWSWNEIDYAKAD